MTNVTDNATNVIPLDDTREKLEADVREWCERSLAIFPEALGRRIYKWLDRQDAITQRECIDRWDDKALALYADAETARKALAEECEEWERVCDKVKAERDELLRKSKEFEQTIAELHGAVCERDGRIGTYERRNTELNDALKAICNRYGVSTQWAAEDAAKKVFESIDSTHMCLPVDADGVPIRPGDVLETSEYNYRRFRCLGFCYETSLTVPRWTVAMEYDGETGTTEYVSAHSCRHVQPDTVESLLEEFYGKTHATTAEEREELAAEYAERIRKVVER